MKLKKVLREELAKNYMKKVVLATRPLYATIAKGSFLAGWEYCEAHYKSSIEQLCCNLESNTIGLSPDQVERITRYIKLSLNNLGDEEVLCQEDQQP